MASKRISKELQVISGVLCEAAQRALEQSAIAAQERACSPSSAAMLVTACQCHCTGGRSGTRVC
jgi:hypothetical protein